MAALERARAVTASTAATAAPTGQLERTIGSV